MAFVQDDRYGDLGELQIQPARDAGAGQAQCRAVTRSGVCPGPQQQRCDDLGPHRGFPRLRGVADIDSAAPGEGFPQLTLTNVEFVETHDRRSSRYGPAQDKPR
ncbi:hypothetical protein [Streptomyces sp. NBC_01314]|uniref:hypothetical protein n=1 Tax=Streptomyces sp. NBC_01314 TaxID=2903821 RepID=UPI00308A84DF|nr:hypothetical protein OG622_03375 [Streptomyces sp. NBC_01314]